MAWLMILIKVWRSKESTKRKKSKLRIVYLLLVSNLAEALAYLCLYIWLRPKPVIESEVSKGKHMEPSTRFWIKLQIIFIIIKDTCYGISEIIFVFEYYAVAVRIKQMKEQSSFFLRKSIVKQMNTV